MSSLELFARCLSAQCMSSRKTDPSSRANRSRPLARRPLAVCFDDDVSSGNAEEANLRRGSTFVSRLSSLVDSTANTAFAQQRNPSNRGAAALLQISILVMMAEGWGGNYISVAFVRLSTKGEIPA
jgi:hypothetical protein